MATFIVDVALPRGAWVRLSQGGPTAWFAVMNVGFVTIEVKKSAQTPVDGGGAMRVAPGRMLPPEDLTRHGLDVWARAAAADGLAAVEAVVTL